MLSLDPGRCLHLRHLGRTTRLLGRNGDHIGRVYCAIKFGSPSCFSGYFLGRFKMLPGSFVKWYWGGIKCYCRSVYLKRFYRWLNCLFCGEATN